MLKIKHLVQHNLLPLYILAGLAASIPAIIKVTTGHDINYRNYTIFVNAFQHLIEHKNIYASYLATEHIDYFKYSPTFAVFMAPFAVLPQSVGVVIWSIFNSLILYVTIKTFKHNTADKLYPFLFMLLASFSSLQNFQTNSMMAVLLFTLLHLLNKNKYFLSMLCMCLAVLLKFYCLFFLIFYIQKENYKYYLTLLTYFLLIFTALVLLPALFIGIHELGILYIEWWKLILADEKASYGLSVMGFISQIIGKNDMIKHLIILLGYLISAALIIKTNWSPNKNSLKKYQSIALAIIALVIFNPRAESQTFVTAYFGVMVWYFSLMNPKNILDKVIFIIAIILGVLAPTDVYPTFLRNQVFVPYCFQAIACLFVWARLVYSISRRN